MNKYMKNDGGVEVDAWYRRWTKSSSHYMVNCPAFLNGKEWKRQEHNFSRFFWFLPFSVRDAKLDEPWNMSQYHKAVLYFK